MTAFVWTMVALHVLACVSAVCRAAAEDQRGDSPIVHAVLALGNAAIAVWGIYLLWPK